MTAAPLGAGGLRRAVAGLMLAGLLAGTITSPAPVHASPPTYQVSEVLGARMRAGNIPGAAYTVVSAQGQVSAGAHGRTGDGTAVTPQTPFVIGSTSKSFTALAVLQLVDEGQVDLDAPVRRYVPELTLAAGEPVDAITVRHLLQQTSGLPGGAVGPVLSSAREGSALEAVAELRRSRLTSAPGTRWAYANANYVLAGLVVERASGMPYRQWIEQRIFRPLGMARSFTSLAAAQGSGLSSGHRLWFGAAIPSGPVSREGILAAGYLISTAEDLGRYLRMYLRGGIADDGTRVVSAEALRTMTSPGPEAHLDAWADGAPSRYTMGWFVGGPWPERAVQHAGNTPDSSAMIVLLPERGRAVAVVMNLSHELPVPGNPGATERLSRAVVADVLGEPGGPAPTVRRFYLIFDAVGILLLGLAGWGLVRSVRAGAAPRRRGSVAAVGILLRVAGAALACAVPLVVWGGWRAALQWGPDLTVLSAALGVILLLAAVLRLTTLLRQRARGAPAGR